MKVTLGANKQSKGLAGNTAVLNRGTVALKAKVSFPYLSLNLLLQNFVDIRRKTHL